MRCFWRACTSIATLPWLLLLCAMRRRIRRAVALAAVAFVASGQVRELPPLRRMRPHDDGRKTAAAPLLHPTFPLALSSMFSTFFSHSECSRGDGTFFSLRPIGLNLRMRREDEERPRGRMCCFFFRLQKCSPLFFSLSLFVHSQASRASSELDEAYASVHAWIDEVRCDFTPANAREEGRERDGRLWGRD